MKKFLTLCLTALMACGLLVGCSKKETPTEVEEPKTEVESGPVEEETDKDETAQIANPWVECDTLEAAVALTGFEVEVKEDDNYTLTYSVIEGEMFEARYVDEDLNAIDVRKSLLSNGEDNSGVYDEFSNIETVEVDKLTVTVKGEGETGYVAIWNDGTYAYSVYVPLGFEMTNLAEMVSLIK